MEFKVKIHKSVLHANKIESAKDKQLLNKRLIQELQDTLKLIAQRNTYLHEYWYMLRFFVKSLHGAYRLLYKILLFYGDSNVCKKFIFHNLIDGAKTYKTKFGTFFTTCQLCFTSISLHSRYSEIQVECANAG